MSDMLKEIEEWFTERPRWVQDAARRIIQNGGITDADLAELVTLCKVEGGACASSTIKPKSIPAGSLVSKEQKVNLRLNAIMNVKGINALAPRKPLLLGDEPLTIIYGQNGSGKSGYVRVLKHACGARKPGKLLGNVFEKSTTETGCTFRITNDSGAKDIDWKPSIGVHEDLSSIEIYDSDCATAYVSQENEVAYEPWILSLFSQLIEVCLKVGQVIKDEIGLKVSTKPILPVNLSATKTGTWYNTLNHKTKDSEIDEQCDWTPDLEKELVQIKQRLAESNPADKAKALRKTIFNAQNLIQTLKNLTDNLQEEKCATYILAKDNALVKRKAADEDAKKVFEGSSVDGVGTESWKLLWEQARKYSNEVAYPQQTFPNVEDNARCVLCHQLLSNEAKIRLESFEKFVQGGLQKEAKEAEQYLETLTNNLGEIPNGEHLNLLMDSSGITDELVRDNIMDFCTALQKRKDSLINAKNTEDLFPLPAKEKLEGLANLIETLEQQAAAFDEDAKSDNRELLVIRHNELEAKKWVSQQRTSIKDEVERLKLVQQLKQSLNLTNTQSLSAKKSSLSNVLITDEYVRRFERELKELGAARIRVQIVKTRGCKIFCVNPLSII